MQKEEFDECISILEYAYDYSMKPERKKLYFRILEYLDNGEFTANLEIILIHYQYFPTIAQIIEACGYHFSDYFKIFKAEFKGAMKPNEDNELKLKRALEQE